MSWNLQQINNATPELGSDVPGEYVACPQATASSNDNVESNVLFVCVFGDQQHFAYQDANGNIQDCWHGG
jgi:hypothetical protein